MQMQKKSVSVAALQNKPLLKWKVPPHTSVKAFMQYGGFIQTDPAQSLLSGIDVCAKRKGIANHFEG